MKKVFLTHEGLEKLKAELLVIQNETLPALEAEITSLEADGLSSSVAIKIAREKHEHYTERVRVLTKMIETCQIIGEREVCSCCGR